MKRSVETRGGFMNIREAGEEDLYRLLKLYTQLHENPMPRMDQQLLQLWNSMVQDENHHIVIAQEGNKIVSSCVLVIVPNLTHGQRPYALIENVITSEAFRNQGLASACLAFAKQIAVEHHCYKIMLLTGSKKENTLNFYRKAGYNSEDKTAFVQWL